MVIVFKMNIVQDTRKCNVGSGYGFIFIWFIITLYYKIRQTLLQIATATLLQNATEVYYKMRQVFYYKMRQVFYYKIRRF